MKKLLLCLGLMTFLGHFAIAQNNISGTVKDANGPLVGVTILIKGTNKGMITDVNGKYSLANAPTGENTVIASFVGYKTLEKKATGNATVDFEMTTDALDLESVVVTGAFDPRTKLQSSVAITTLNARAIEQRSARGTGDFLQAVPGIFVDNSGGEINAAIFARGLANGNVGTGGQGTGFRYIALMEDGLPITSTLLGYSAPDILHRADATVGRFEAVRGGSASVAIANSPGGVYNFISKEGGSKFAGEARLQYGLHNNGNSLIRGDLNLGGPIAGGWNYNIGGFYRTDEGARTTPFLANVGGQVKANISKTTAKGKIKLYAKFLNDRNTVFRNLPFDNLTNPKPMFGFDANNSSTITQLNSKILPNGSYFLTDKTAVRDWDAENAVRAKTQSIGLDFTRDLSANFSVSNNARYTSYNTRFNQITAEQVLPINSFDGLGGTTITAVQTGEELYNLTNKINKLGSFIMLTVPLDMRNKVTDFADQLTFKFKTNQHTLSFGGYFASSNLNIEWDADLVAQAVEPNPRVLRITTNNPFAAATGGQPTRLELTDVNGWYSYGSVAVTRVQDHSTTKAIFANDVWQVNDKLSIDAAVRWEAVTHDGEKQYWRTPALGTLALPASLALVNQIGADGKYGTRYDVSMRYIRGESSKFDFTQSYISWSAGLNYKLSNQSAAYVRFTRGNKAPDTDFYANNFVNVPVEAGTVETITMGELGYKINSKNVALAITGFYSNLANLPFTQLIVNTVTGQTFYSPPTFNTSITKGFEIEANVSAGKIFSLAMIGTFQDAIFKKFAFYNVNGFQHPIFIGETYPAINPTAGTPYLVPNNTNTPSFPQLAPNTPIAAGTASFHKIENLDGKKVDGIPNVMIDITPSFNFGKFNIHGNARYTGERQYNKQNALVVPAYTVLNGGASFSIKGIELGVRINNAANSAAIIANDGLGRPDAAGVDAIKTVDIERQKTIGYPFWGRPMLPRQILFNLSYKF